MKRILLLALVLTTAISCNVKKKPTTDEAIAHNDAIVEMFDPYYSAADEFGYALLDDEASAKPAYEKLSHTIDSILTKLNALPQFDEQDALKKAAVDYMTALKKITETERKKMTGIKENPDYRNAESEKYQDLFNEYQEAYDRAEKAETKVSDEFDAKQKTFAAGYNFTIG